MAHITHSVRPVVSVRLDAGERFDIASNYPERSIRASQFDLGQDYGDNLIIMLSGYGIKKDGSESAYRYQRQLSVTEVMEGNVPELSKIVLAFLQQIVGDAILRWDSMGDFIQAYDTRTGKPDVGYDGNLAITGRHLRKYPL